MHNINLRAGAAGAIGNRLVRREAQPLRALWKPRAGGKWVQIAALVACWHETVMPVFSTQVQR
jgi:hypothetical protein